MIEAATASLGPLTRPLAKVEPALLQHADAEVKTLDIDHESPISKALSDID